MTFCDLRGWLLPARLLCFSVLSLPLKAASGPTQAVPQAFPNSVVQELGQRKTGKSGVGGEGLNQFGKEDTQQFLIS